MVMPKEGTEGSGLAGRDVLVAKNGRIEETQLAKRGKKIPRKLAKRAKQILVLLMDVDGTLTDGSVTLLSQSDGSALDLKNFDAHDGQALTLPPTPAFPTHPTTAPPT